MIKHKNVKKNNINKNIQLRTIYKDDINTNM